LNLAETVEGLPVRRGVREGDHSLIEWRDGAMQFDVASTIARMGPSAVDFIFARGIGHVLAATDEQLRLPNLGLPFDGSPRPPAEEIKRTETVATGASLLFFPENADRIIRVAKGLFKVEGADVALWLSEWNPERVRVELASQFEKLRAG
jgi:hypothetical protein